MDREISLSLFSLLIWAAKGITNIVDLWLKLEVFDTESRNIRRQAGIFKQWDDILGHFTFMLEESYKNGCAALLLFSGFFYEINPRPEIADVCSLPPNCRAEVLLEPLCVLSAFLDPTGESDKWVDGLRRPIVVSLRKAVRLKPLLEVDIPKTLRDEVSGRLDLACDLLGAICEHLAKSTGGS